MADVYLKKGIKISIPNAAFMNEDDHMSAGINIDFIYNTSNGKVEPIIDNCMLNEYRGDEFKIVKKLLLDRLKTENNAMRKQLFNNLIWLMDYTVMRKIA